MLTQDVEAMCELADLASTPRLSHRKYVEQLTRDAIYIRFPFSPIIRCEFNRSILLGFLSSIPVKPKYAEVPLGLGGPEGKGVPQPFRGERAPKGTPTHEGYV